ncbi:hypothetical protein ES703_86681 [subsurface metagenome]
MKRVSITEELAYGTALDRLTGTDKPAPAAKKGGTTTPPGVTRIKLSVFLSHAEDAYLENLASTAKFSGGKKLSKTRLVEAMVRAFRATKLDVRGVKNDKELLERVSAQLR